MSLSVANMCRFVVAVVFISFISCVVSATPDGKEKNITECAKSAPIKNSRNKMDKCFSDLVLHHLYNSSDPGQCVNTTQFDQAVKSYLNVINVTCGVNYNINTTNLTSFIDFSLRNESFKDLYNDVECIKKLESNISKCVKENLGSFNITKEMQHSSLPAKIFLVYNKNSCTKSKLVQNCVEGVLNQCKPTTRRYVSTLFEFSLKNCGNFTDTPTEPNDDNGTISTKSAPWMTFLAIIAIFIKSIQ